MAVTHLHVAEAPEDVFAVLADPWRYADWVVGAKRIRGVDANWPRPGSRFFHRFGVGPFTVDDSTVVEEIEPPRHLVLRARARPHGVARIDLTLDRAADGGTDVTMDEYPVSGPARWLDNPVFDRLVVARNRVSLRRLAELAAERRSG